MNSEKRPLYFITAMPPAGIRKQIEDLKKEIRDKFRIKHALKLPAHITLQIPFRIEESREKVLVTKLKNFSKTECAFPVRIEDFDKFSKKVIFIKVEDHEPFIELQKRLEKIILNFTDLKSHEISSNIHPHVTIATRDLRRTDFPQVWDEFKDRHYSASFKVEDLYLLKHNGKTWEILRSFKLSNKI